MWTVDEEFVWLHSVSSAGAFQIGKQKGSDGKVSILGPFFVLHGITQDFTV